MKFGNLLSIICINSPYISSIICKYYYDTVFLHNWVDHFLSNCYLKLGRGSVLFYIYINLWISQVK